MLEHLIQQMIDREAIRACEVRLARGEDRRHADLIASCWWPEAKFDYGVHSGDFSTYLAWVVPGADAIKNTQHIIGQTYVELTGEFSARAETHVVSYHRVDMGEGDRDICIGGRYLDTMEKRGEQWCIADRIMLYDWEQEWGAAADWSKGVMGYPFAADRSSGRAVGDFSEAWFAGAST